MRGAGGAEENGGGTRRRLPKLKIPAKIWKNRRATNQGEEDGPDEEEQVEEVEVEERLEELTRRLNLREDELFSREERSEEDEDALHKDLELLSLRVWMAVNDTFAPPTASSSARHLEALRSAAESVRLQEAQDRRWKDGPRDGVPVWRPLRWQNAHSRLLQEMVENRLTEAGGAESGDTQQLSSDLKRQVCRVGKRVKEDLLAVVRTVRDVYPETMDVLNVYAGLYHQAFSARLDSLASAPLPDDDLGYLLLWVNHCYPREILEHEELDGRIKMACLGSLLRPDVLQQLEEHYLGHREAKVKLWLSAVLRKEEESWRSGKTPELIDGYCFSPLAVDAVQVVDGALAECRYAVRDQSAAQRLTAHLESFLCSYRKSVEELLKAPPTNLNSLIKAQLVCEQQLRDYVTGQTGQTGQTGSFSEEQRRRCLDVLSALRDAGFQSLTCPVRGHIKASLRPLWTSAWVDGSLAVVDSLLGFLHQQLAHLEDLKPTCRQALLHQLHQDVVARYVKKTLKSRMKSRQQQVGGAQRMADDGEQIDGFFREEGGAEAPWLREILCSLAEILRLQDPASVHLEVVDLARRFPDFSGAHVAALLSLKFGLTAADVRSIRASAEENRPPEASANRRPPFFHRVKVKWIKQKINQMGMKS